MVDKAIIFSLYYLKRLDILVLYGGLYEKYRISTGQKLGKLSEILSR